MLTNELPWKQTSIGKEKQRNPKKITISQILVIFLNSQLLSFIFNLLTTHLIF